MKSNAKRTGAQSVPVAMSVASARKSLVLLEILIKLKYFERENVYLFFIDKILTLFRV